ncbi:MAG TPA: hypothetical protein GXX29_12745 [Firmicutes bacterium]|nr:hypothetical protein [Bacillota bacterium]
MVNEKEQWFSNKDLLVMMQSLQGELIELRAELRVIADAVRRYNGLRERLEETERKLDAHILTGAGQAGVARGIREWGGWVMALLALILSWYMKLSSGS